MSGILGNRRSLDNQYCARQEQIVIDEMVQLCDFYDNLSNISFVQATFFFLPYFIVSRGSWEVSQQEGTEVISNRETLNPAPRGT